MIEKDPSNALWKRLVFLNQDTTYFGLDKSISFSDFLQKYQIAGHLLKP